MDSEVSGTMEVAALGRPFRLGMLYDCRNDSLVPGITLWDRKDITNDIEESAQSYNDCNIVASESIEDKYKALNVKASGGLVEVGGSAKYLNDSETSKNHASVTLNYKATTKFHELSMDQLGRGNVKHSYVFDQGIATHVVTGILYGAQAFFVFDREVSGNENYQDIQGNLKVMIEKIHSLSKEGEDSLKMKEKDKTNVEKFSCRFHGDFDVQKPPTSFQDAVEVYQSLPNLLGANGEKAVPVKVWLLPLTFLDSTDAKLAAGRSKESIAVNVRTTKRDLKSKGKRINSVIPQVKESQTLEELKAAVEGLQPQVKAGLAKLEQIKTTKEKIKEHETAMTSNENFVIEVDVIKPVKKLLTKKGEYITNCQNCSITCHYPCTIPDNSQKRGCASMDSSGRCTVCPGKCIWSLHFNQTYSWDYVHVKETQTLEELKVKYNKAAKEKMTVQELIESQEEEIDHLQEMIVSLMDQSSHSLTRLQEIALRPNPLTTPDYIDMLIEGEKAEAKVGYQARVRSLEEMREKATIISRVANRQKLTKTEEELSREKQEMQKKKTFLKKVEHFFGY